MIRKVCIGVVALCGTFSCKQQAVAPVLRQSNYRFELVSELPNLPVLDQGGSGTCWAFAMASFLESEIIRQSGRQIDLSEMYLVRHTYTDKAENHLLRRGQMPFREGALNPDPIHTAIRYGIVPQTVYTGLLGNATRHDHRELFGQLEGIVKKHVDGKSNGAGWRNELAEANDRHLGPDVPTFTYNGQSFTPATFRDFTGLQLDRYVHITSITHKPFYKPMVLAAPDNFSNAPFQNVPLDEYMQNLNHALDRGFTVAVELDVSEPTFSGDYGLAVIPDAETDNDAILTDPKPEKNVSQTYRQQELENFRTTNDHNVHIVGRVKDQTGKVYYKAKNSWSDKWSKGGYIYMSAAYVRLKVFYYSVHQDALLPATRQSLKL